MSDKASTENDRRVILRSGAAPGVGRSATVKAGGWVFVAGHMPVDDSGLLSSIPTDTDNPNLFNELEVQSQAVLQLLATSLSEAGCEISRDVARIYQWLPSAYPTREQFERGDSWTGRDGLDRIVLTPHLRVLHKMISEPRPASSALGVRQLLAQGARIEVDLIAVEPTTDLQKQGIGVPEGEPAPLAGYSPAVRSGDWIFTAGFIAVDYRSDYWNTDSALAREAEVHPHQWYGIQIETQTDYILQRLERLAAAAGSSLDRCVKAEVYLGNPRDFAGMDRVWKEWFPNNPPARVVVPYMGIGAKGCRVEIALVLLAGDSNLTIATVETADAPEPVGHEPQATRAGNLLFLSTQQAADSSGRLAQQVRSHPHFPFAGQPAKLQMEYVLRNVNAICEAAGSSLSQICRVQAFYEDLTWHAEAMDYWDQQFPFDPPVSTSVGIRGPLVVPGCKFVLDSIAYVPQSDGTRNTETFG